MRRALTCLAFALAPVVAAQEYPPVVPGHRLEFPRDHGAHPEYRTEWWYVTGWLETGAGTPLGFQVTFFRVRPRLGEASESRFAPRQLLFAHAALADAGSGRLLHDERAARAGFGLAEAALGRTEVWIDDWSLRQDGEGYVARVAADAFALELRLDPPGPPLLNGEDGFSRKGPAKTDASYYYSRPQLRVSGRVRQGGKSMTVSGSAWLDHEWSSAYMPESAVGWDWIGINLDDGGALMAFRMRDAQGATLWAGGTLRRNDGSQRAFAPQEVRFEPLRQWRSPRTGTDYPVAWRVVAGDLALTLQPLMDDQELDSRASVGAVYWEGAARAFMAGREVGRGYLELTGYWQRLRMGGE